MKKLIKRLSTVSAELLLIFGAFFIVAATSKVSLLATIYLVGGLLIAAGLFIAKNRR